MIHSHQGTRADSHVVVHDHAGDDDHTHSIWTSDYAVDADLLDEYWERYGPAEPLVIAAKKP